MGEETDDDGGGSKGGINDRLGRMRDRIRDRPAVNLAYRIGVGVVGSALLIVGIVAIPYPGPGWAILFLGLGVLATEFSVFHRLLKDVRRRYDAGMKWFRRQNVVVQALGTVLTIAVTLASLWLLGALGWAADLMGLDWAWLKSPLGLGTK